MKKETIYALLTEMESGELTDNDINRLFDIYTSLEITKIEDLFRDHSGFYKFIGENLKFFQAESDLELNSIKSSAVKRVNGCFNDFSNKHYRFYRRYYEEFADLVDELVGHEKDVKILEVGGGTVPYSSILLSDRGYKDVTAIDDFYISPTCLSKLNVKSNRQLFNAKTSVKDYDVVVGRRPCSAISHIVKNCSSEDVPYLIRLCGCNAPFRNIEQWKPILTKIDGDISYLSAYAYNLSNASFATPSDMSRIIAIDSDKALG